MGIFTDFFSQSIGFEMREIMSGTHRFVEGEGPEGEFPFEFKVAWGTDDILKWIRWGDEDFLKCYLKGYVSVGGLCENVDVSGSLEIRYFTEAKIRYTFEFETDGKRYIYTGEKVNIKPWNLPVSHTTCFGTVVEKGTKRLISRSVVFFRYSYIPAFLLSFRLKRKRSE